MPKPSQANCAANEIAELHLGILNAIETQAREAEHKVNILTQQVNYIVEQIKTLRTRLGKLDLDSDLHIDQEALGPKLDRIYSILADQTLIRSHSNTKFMSKTYSKNRKALVISWMIPLLLLLGIFTVAPDRHNLCP
ncbi:hypothetical protein MJO28_013082 [Puccinia striiformis f. sp. tritici]|uniref:Uncharacterized protein n=1 Tax=Puccinia striiformis f. sp. tritici TaxID=168172 RepID=A0ACC0E074_9BASI|nr:hypothetical protein MJO28_013082 [Puccinia striiformis f. sp. tritici]KAI7943148.1 hypothetical protein MJO29_012992 [Puccinia striiformis f. sp. tritici]